MHILILSYYFPPYNTIGAIRVGKFARYLTELGHTVDVVAANEPALEQNDASLPVEIPAEHVKYTRWWDINGPPRAAAAWLKRRGSRPPGTSSSRTVSPTLESLPA